MRFLFIIITVALVYPINGQTCNCESNFAWVKKTFEENDAGFQYIIDKKVQSAYNIHNQLMLGKVESAKTFMECEKLLYEWLTFFRSGHIGIERLVNTSTQQNVSQTPNATGTYETWEVDIPQFEKYISTKKEADYEGIWDLGGIYKIGIKKDGVNYIGFIIESDVDGWREPGQVKLKIEQDGIELKSTFFMRDHSSVESGEPELVGDNHLEINGQLLKRLSPVFPKDPFVDHYYKAMYSQNPFLEELNETTLYLRIPTFDPGHKSAIDKVIADNKDRILKTKNLIIDLRYNGGGGDASYAELLPFLYTNPVRTLGVELLSTTQNNQLYLDYTKRYELYEETQRRIKETYDKLQGREGEFVRTSDESVSIKRSDIIYEYPKNVGIIINKGNGSTAEQFLFAAKQSKKVKLFGVTTAGALDISNMIFIESPCKEFELGYCMSRSLRIPDIGLQPDYFLDKTIPQYKWIEFVNDILNH